MQIPIEIRYNKSRSISLYPNKIVIECGKYDYGFISEVKSLIVKARTFNELIQFLKTRKNKYHFQLYTYLNGYNRYGLYVIGSEKKSESKKEEKKEIKKEEEKKVKIELIKEDYEKLKIALSVIKKRDEVNPHSFQKAIGKSVYNAIKDVCEIARRYFNL